MSNKTSGHKPAKNHRKEVRRDGRKKMSFRLPGMIAATLTRIAKDRKCWRQAPWEKQDIVENGLRMWFQKYKVQVQ